MKIFDLESHKFANIFPMVEGEQSEQLKEDIKEHGLLQPVVLFEGKILDGRNRYRACKEIGIKPKIKNYEGNDPLSFVISGNLKRRHLTKDQRAVIAQEVMPLLEEEARKRQGSRTDLTSGNFFPEVEKGRPSEKAGKMFNVNERYIREVKKIKENRPEQLEKIKSGELTLMDVKREERIKKINKQKEDLERESLNNIEGDYDVIVIDPPWKYFEEDSTSYDPKTWHTRGVAPYPTMSIEQIKNITLPAKDDCVLWLWTTNKHIFDCREILNSWGFEIKSILTWDKDMIGIGRWLRSQTEHCILAIKGKPYFNNTKWSTLIREKRTTHSTKPQIFYTIVNEICAGRKLDYFARKKREGWDVYGDEV